MFTSSSCPTGAPAADELFTAKAATRDDESRLAAAFRTTYGDTDAPIVPQQRNGAPPALSRSSVGSVSAATKRVVAEIVHAVEARLPGRIAGLKVVVLEDQFVLHGISSSYYVKQVAGHLAMTTMDACLLGRLVNEIEVRSVR